MRKQPSFVILGPQGSGKGTQARILAEKINFAYFSTGEEFKKIRQENSPLGRQIRRYYDKGKLCPDALVRQVLIRHFPKLQQASGVIFDGFPRSFSQLKILNDFIKKYNINEPTVIYLDISEKESIKRISQRRICSICGRTFYPKDVDYKTGQCLTCKKKLVMRADDKPDIVKQRLAIYHQETEPILKHYQDKKKLIRINGMPSIVLVSQDIFNQLKARHLYGGQTT